jgi:hypothetical protein
LTAHNAEQTVYASDPSLLGLNFEMYFGDDVVGV